MKLSERKKNLSKKLDYLGYHPRYKERTLKFHYGIIGRITKSYIGF
jgi:hypothetical protein